MKVLAAFAIFALPVIGGVAKHTVFGGAGWIWPWLLASCAVAALFNWRAALLLSVGIGGAQVIEQTYPGAPWYQFALYVTLGFCALAMHVKVAAFAAALVATLYLAAATAVAPWFLAVVASEFVLVFGLIGGVYHGPSGGVRDDRHQRSAGNAAALAPVHPGRLHHFLRDEQSGLGRA